MTLLDQKLRTKPRSPGEKDEFIDTLRKELLFLIEKKLSPVALRYGYSKVPLESKITWKPIVLVLGNYSSGKSTLINEFVGAKVQDTGQAPTDDSFTVITCDDDADSAANLPDGQVYEERDGSVLLGDYQYPFTLLRRFGDHFAARIRLKKVKSKALRNLAIIDTPGMLDSAADSERKYDFQGVIGELAMISDLVLVLFDPHKAGTIKESHFSLKHTLPEKIFEDRLIFVLNRIDECSNLNDLLRVYGTLCWNLSQMTGRKDIPSVLLTYAPSVSHTKNEADVSNFLSMLENQRQQLNEAIYNAPKHRLDHLASFVEHHGRRLDALLAALIAFKRERLSFQIRMSFVAIVFALLCGGLAGAYGHVVRPFDFIVDEATAAMFGGGVSLGVYVTLQLLVNLIVQRVKHKRMLQKVEQRTDFEDDAEKEIWNSIKPLLMEELIAGNLPAMRILRREKGGITSVLTTGVDELRAAINKIN